MGIYFLLTEKTSSWPTMAILFSEKMISVFTIQETDI